jgi:hypothetical protein
MDSYSIRLASGRISPNLDPRVGDCWLDTTGEVQRAQRPGRYKARDVLSMPPGQGRGGTDDLALLGKQSIKLHPYFQTNAAVPIDSNVATGSRLLRPHCIPDQPTALRHDARKLGCAGLASDDCEGHTIELVELDCRGRQWTVPYYVEMASAVTPRRTADLRSVVFVKGPSLPQ